jgi:hypothetical protein
MAAASDDAPPSLVREALALPATQGLDLDTLWISAGLALREHQGMEALQAEFDRQAPPGMARQVAKKRRLWALLQEAARSARPLDAAALRGFDPEERGHLYAALAVALGPKAPASYRVAASRLLFATERPHFNQPRRGTPA